jgi:hypothetical protein
MQCDGVKPPITKQLIKMNDFNINYLRKDMRFIEDAISISNTSKKSLFDIESESKVSKRSKNLRYFLRKKRNIIYKNAPS